jgi:integration host factor subunit alpha
MTLTKNCITEKIQEELGFKRNKSFELTETLLEIIKSTLENGEDVLVSGFGKFCVQRKAERKGRNPATGGNMMLPARRIVTFKCSNRLRAKISGKR